jgi:hypothetical protein
LIRLLARGHDWAMRLVSGQAGSIREIASAEKVTASHVRLIAQLGFIAAPLLAAICRGEHPPHLTARRLRDLGELPLRWSEQRVFLGFDSRAK